MTWIEHTRLSGVTCDAHDCDAAHRCVEGPFWQIRGALIESATDRGWRMFVGRSQRWYCPDHGPRQPTKMRQVYP